jgi:hypothetical protein
MKTWLRLCGYLGFAELMPDARSFVDGVLNCRCGHDPRSCSGSCVMFLKSRVPPGRTRMLASRCTRVDSVQPVWAQTTGMGPQRVFWIAGPWSGVCNGPGSRVGPRTREGRNSSQRVYFVGDSGLDSNLSLHLCSLSLARSSSFYLRGFRNTSCA